MVTAPSRPGLVQRRQQALEGELCFAVDEYDDVRCANAQGSDQNAFENAMRVTFEEMAVFVDARFAFLGVYEQEFLLGRVLRAVSHFAPTWEVRAAAATQD